jgi:mannose-6-phosphate isomerase-like protein (cupin superfamily)
MSAYQLEKLLEGHNWTDHRYFEFINIPSLSAGIYRLSAGVDDTQQPHSEDEIYYVISGRSKFQHENETREIHSGTILFVPAQEKHFFYDITEDLTILVFFAPAERSQP